MLTARRKGPFRPMDLTAAQWSGFFVPPIAVLVLIAQGSLEGVIGHRESNPPRHAWGYPTCWAALALGLGGLNLFLFTPEDIPIGDTLGSKAYTLGAFLLALFAVFVSTRLLLTAQAERRSTMDAVRRVGAIVSIFMISTISLAACTFIFIPALVNEIGIG